MYSSWRRKHSSTSSICQDCVATKTELNRYYHRLTLETYMKAENPPGFFYVLFSMPWSVGNKDGMKVSWEGDLITLNSSTDIEGIVVQGIGHWSIFYKDIWCVDLCPITTLLARMSTEWDLQIAIVVNVVKAIKISTMLDGNVPNTVLSNSIHALPSGPKGNQSKKTLETWRINLILSTWSV